MPTKLIMKTAAAKTPTTTKVKTHKAKKLKDQDNQGYCGVDIEDEPLFHEELSHQANAQKNGEADQIGWPVRRTA